MTTVELSNAISMIDENIFSDILEERYQRTATQKKTRKPAFFFRRFSFAAAAVAACVIVAVFAMQHFKNQPSNLPNVDPLPTTDTTPSKNPTPTVVAPPEQTVPPAQGGINNPGYVPAYSTPSLDQIYAMTPFDKLFPRKVLDDYQFYKSYKTEYDPVLGAGVEYLHVMFTPSQDVLFSQNLEIYVSDNIEHLELADITNPQSFDLTNYYEEKEKNELPVKGNYHPAFLPEHISEEILQHRIHKFDDGMNTGMCKAEIRILFENYVVSYSYYGLPITAGEFHEMITSAQWFH